MLGLLRHLLPLHERDGPACVPVGTRVYAVGDIHGHLDLFSALATAIATDDRHRNDQHHTHPFTTVILLGDLIDRGPDSAGVLAFAQDWQRRANLRILAGNHEETLLASFNNIDTLYDLLVNYGGRATLTSFGITAQTNSDSGLAETQDHMRRIIPADMLAFIHSFEDMIQIGDYAFVHAGIRPGCPLDQQSPRDMRWIRKPFLESRYDHGAVIVHGHTIVEDVEITRNRIGIDTGAYTSGRLTALGLEGTSRWLLQARKNRDGVITIRHRALV